MTSAQLNSVLCFTRDGSSVHESGIVCISLIKVQLLHQAQARHWVIKSFENQTLITMSLPDRCQAGETGSTDLPGT